MLSPLPDIIHRKINRLKRLLRFYSALDGIALFILTALLLLVLDFGLDRFFEFSQILRLTLLPILCVCLVYVFAKHILYRCCIPLRSAQLAAVLEHYVPRLNESLFTAVEWSADDEFDTDLMEQTIAEAAATLQKVNVCRFFNANRLVIRIVSAFVCTALLAAFCYTNSATASLWFSRNILLSQREYPRRSQLLVDGFQDGKIRIARGDSFTLSVRANMQKPLVPESIRVRIGTEEIGYRTLLIDEFHTETREGTRWRVFVNSFPEMLETVTLQIRGADTTLNDFSVEVVPPPMLTDLMLQQKFPDYINREERTIALVGRTVIPDGTEITLSATSTKPLRKTVVIVNEKQYPLSQASKSLEKIELSLPAVREETLIDFRLTDMDSLTNRQPIRVELGIVKDQPPVVTARLEGIGSAITPEAVMPIVGEITDDNGLASAMVRYTAEPAPSPAEASVPLIETQRLPADGAVPMTELSVGQTVFSLNQSFSVTPLAVLPGDKLNVWIEACDKFNLDSSQGQLGQGQRFQLEIVTPEQLKTLLETREIALRQRFEVILGEVERTKNILTDYSLEPTDQQIKEAESLVLTERENETSSEKASRQQELETRKRALLDTILSEQAERGMYHIARMLRDTQKETFDIIGIVGAFQGIRLEMVNNRIFTEDERRRIDIEIMQPMQDLVNRDFPDIDRLLGLLNQLLLDREKPRRPTSLAERQNILDQFDQTILKMSAIRDKMASMESFNEAVELLRVIIKQQQQLKNETIEEKNQRLRDLID